MKPFAPFLSVTLALVVALCAFALPAQAQSEAIALASLQIELWPEFDKPATLVILAGRLESAVALPAEVTVRLPAASGGPFAVATRSASDELTNAPYTTTLSGGQILVTFQTDLADFHVEYYDPALTITGQARDYSFSWTTDYAVRDAAIRVQEPVDTTNLTADPALTPAGPGDYGLNYYISTLGALNAGQTVSLHLSYSKSSSALSSTVATSPTPAQVSKGAPLIDATSLGVGAGAAAVVLVLTGGAYWYVQNRRQWQGGKSRNAGRNTARHRPRRPGQDVAASSQVLPASFCPQCGQRLQPGDLFCRQCGAPARK
jgi:hypothetical protein